METLVTYSTANYEAFTSNAQAAIDIANRKAISEGFPVEELDLRYVVSKVKGEWVVVLLIPSKKETHGYKEFIGSYPV
jgi:hypothetical protein